MEELSLDSTEGQFEHLRQLAVFGNSNADPAAGTIRVREKQSPWDVYYPAERRSGKTARLQIIDELVDQLREMYPYPEVKLLAEKAMAAKRDDMPVTVRWKCAKPTDRPDLVLEQGFYAAPMPELIPGFGDLMRRWLEKR